MAHKISISNLVIKFGAIFFGVFLFLPFTHASAFEDDIFHVPGSVSGIDTHFEVIDSAYLNLVLDSSEEIKVSLDSIPQMILLNIEPTTTATSTNISFSGLEPNHTYYKYQDDYHNETIIQTTASGQYSYTQDISTPHFIFIQPTTGTKFISDNATGGDCVTIGNWNSATKTCTLTGNINQTIQIDSNGITLDGAGFTNSGSNSFGVYIYQKSAITIQNVTISGFSIGIFTNDATNITITENQIVSGSHGIVIQDSYGAVITHNATSGFCSGITIDTSGSIITDNNFTSFGGCAGMIILGFNHNIQNNISISEGVGNGGSFNIRGNTTIKNNVFKAGDGYADMFIDAGTDADCRNATIENNNGTDNAPLVFVNSLSSITNQTFSELILCDADGSHISNVQIESSGHRNGIFLQHTDNTTIENTISSNNLHGIFVNYSHNNRFINNTFSDNLDNGIRMHNSEGAAINGNSIVGNTKNGIFSHSSSSLNLLVPNEIYNNTITNNVVGIDLTSTSANIYNNNLVNNHTGILAQYHLGVGSYTVYNNNFIQNAVQAVVFGGSATFNLSQPTGGNYWSNYDTPAEGCNDANSDNFCDAPYIFSGDQDNLPWIIQDGWTQTTPTLSNLNQYKSDGITTIPEEDITIEDIITFKATLNSPQDLNLKLQVELRQITESFTGTFDGGIIESPFVPSGQEVAITRFGLVDAQYHWRARAVDTNGNISDWQEFEVGGNVDFEIKKTIPIDIAVILTEPSNVPHESSEITAQPCKLIPEKIYPNGHNIDYFQDLAFCVEDYHRENSFGIVDLNFEFFDNGGEWFKLTTLPSSAKQLVLDTVSVSGLDLNQFDIAGIIYAGDESLFGALTWTPINQPFQPIDDNPFVFVAAETRFTGTWAHEFGHIIGELVIPPPDNTMLPDLYEMGNVGNWDLMASGSRNENGGNPPHMSSYLKEFLQWMRYDIHAKSDFGEFWINSLDSSKLGDSIFRYNLKDNNSPSTQEYYILEARNRNLKTWDTSLPKEKALILYHIDENNEPEYGYNQKGKINNSLREVTIPTVNESGQDGILDPATNEFYRDWDNMVKFAAKSDGLSNGQYRILAEVKQLNSAEDFPFINLAGVILKPNSIFRNKISFNQLAEPVPTKYNKVIAEILAIDVSPTEVTQSELVQDNLSSYPIIKVRILESQPIDNKAKVEDLDGKEIYVVIYPHTKIYGELDVGKIIDANLRWGGDPDLGGYVGFDLQETSIVQDLSNEKDHFDPSDKEDAASEGQQPKKKTTAVVLFAAAVSIIMAGYLLLRYSGLKLFSIVLFILISLSINYVSEPNLNKNNKFIDLQQTTSNELKEVPVPLPVKPDLDLHLFCDDGRHVGPNYETGEYDIQVMDAIVSGDNSNSPEWILIPENNDNCDFKVFARDNKVFLEENPESGEGIEDLLDSYDIYARFIDPDTGIFTSSILEENTINPGETYIHRISGTSDISVSEGALEVQIRIEPETLNLTQKGQFTVFLSIDNGFQVNIEDIDTNSIILAGASARSAIINKGKNEIILKFNTQELVGVPAGEEVALTITGRLFDNTSFEGSDVIRVIKKDGFVASILNTFSARVDLFTSMFAKIIAIFINGY